MNKKQRHINKLVKKFIKKGLKYNYKKNNFEKAIQMFDKAIELNPNNANAYKHRGDVYLCTDLEKAIKDYTKAIELKPNYIGAYSARASIYYSPLVDVPIAKAIEDYVTILNYTNNFCKAYEYLGEILYANEDYEWADFMFTKAIELQPQKFYHYRQRGKNYIKLQEYDKAIEDFTVAITSDIWYDKVEGYRFLAKIYCLLKDNNLAIEFYTKAIDLCSNKTMLDNWDYDLLIQCYKYRSEEYLQLGEKEKADMDLELMAESKLKQKEMEELIAF